MGHDTPESQSGSILDQTQLSYYIYRVLGAFVPLVPPQIGYAVFRALGDLSYSVATRSRESVRDNLHHVLGPKAKPAQMERQTRQAFRTQAYNYYDLFRVASLSSVQITRLVTVHNLEFMDQALSWGKGVILVSAHFGNVDIVAQAFAVRGYPITVVAEPLRPERLYRYVASLRASRGMRLVPADQFLRPLFRALRDNEIVGLAADRDLTGRGTLVDFFGAPALLPDGSVRLALRSGAAIVPAFGLRRADGAFDALIEPPLVLENTGNVQSDIRSGMARLVEVLEKHIARYPGQWVIFEPVWKMQKRMKRP
jgi:KDO2-lipid IV(A) lauroyltransferase